MEREIEGELMPGEELEVLGKAKKRGEPVPDDYTQQEPSERFYTPIEELVDAEVLEMIEADKRRHGPGWEGDWD